jgi:hypothetical protein
VLSGVTGHDEASAAEDPNTVAVAQAIADLLLRPEAS